MKASHLSELVNKLKPCAFCGGQAALEPANKVHWRVRCKSDTCGATNWVQFEPERAAEVWNKRV
jgi:hypothetical protein